MGNENGVKIRIENLSLAFGGVEALSDVSLDISCLLYTSDAADE